MRIKSIFIWTNLNPLYPKMRCVRFGWHWPPWFWRRRFLNSSMYFCFFEIISLGKSGALHLNKYEFPSLKNAFCQVWLKVVQWFWEKECLIYQCIFTISLLSSLWKGQDSSFEQTWVLITQGCCVPSLVEIIPVVLEKKILKYNQLIFATCISWLSPLGKRQGPSFEQTLIDLHQRMHCARFGWK